MWMSRPCRASSLCWGSGRLAACKPISVSPTRLAPSSPLLIAFLDRGGEGKLCCQHMSFLQHPDPLLLLQAKRTLSPAAFCPASVAHDAATDRATPPHRPRPAAR